MRRVNIHLDEEVDRRAEAEARRRGVSKAALIRQGLDTVLGDGGSDPIDDLVGMSDADPVEDIDSVIYGA